MGSKIFFMSDQGSFSVFLNDQSVLYLWFGSNEFFSEESWVSWNNSERPGYIKSSIWVLRDFSERSDVSWNFFLASRVSYIFDSSPKNFFWGFRGLSEGSGVFLRFKMSSVPFRLYTPLLSWLYTPLLSTALFFLDGGYWTWWRQTKWRQNLIQLLSTRHSFVSGS